MDRDAILSKLPRYSYRNEMVRREQSVFDIMREVLDAHEHFAGHYDTIAEDFAGYGSNEELAKALFVFCKANIVNKTESERAQTTKSPSALLTQGHGDCKHYSGFIAGVLDALRRRGVKVNFVYRFASYNAFDKTPGHVFIVMKDGGEEFWIDPVLKKFNQRVEPSWIIDKRIKNLYMLSRLSGVEEFNRSSLLDEADAQLPLEVVNALELLYRYKIVNDAGRVNDGLLNRLSRRLAPAEFEKLANARIILQEQAIGGFFEDLWRGFKKVTVSVPRNAFLSLVAINAFGFAAKLHRAIYNQDGSYRQPGQGKVYNKWRSLGGDWKNIKNAINSGYKKKAILGNASIGVAAAGVPAWVATASAIIAAIMPLVKEILHSQGDNEELMNFEDFNGGNYPNTTPPPSNTPNPMQWIQDNPLLVGGAAAAAIYFYSKSKRRKAA